MEPDCSGDGRQEWRAKAGKVVAVSDQAGSVQEGGGGASWPSGSSAKGLPKSDDDGWRACSWRGRSAAEGVTGHLPLERVAAHESSGEGKAFPL